MPTLPADHGSPHELLRELCRRLADLASWDRSVGDDTPRFGLMFRDLADALALAARTLATHPQLSSDVELAQRVVALAETAARPTVDPPFNQDVLAAGHDVADRAEDVLGVVW